MKFLVRLKNVSYPSIYNIFNLKLMRVASKQRRVSWNYSRSLNCRFFRLLIHLVFFNGCFIHHSSLFRTFQGLWWEKYRRSAEGVVRRLRWADGLLLRLLGELTPRRRKWLLGLLVVVPLREVGDEVALVLPSEG
jgi:hypothetical protein